MYAGQVIEHIVRPLFSIPLSWMIENTFVDDKKNCCWHCSIYILLFNGDCLPDRQASPLNLNQGI